MNAAGDSNKVAIKAATKTLTGMIPTLTPALTMWTAVPDKNKTNMNEQSTPILVVKSSDTSRRPVVKRMPVWLLWLV